MPKINRKNIVRAILIFIFLVFPTRHYFASSSQATTKQITFPHIDDLQLHSENNDPIFVHSLQFASPNVTMLAAYYENDAVTSDVLNHWAFITALKGYEQQSFSNEQFSHIANRFKHEIFGNMDNYINNANGIMAKREIDIKVLELGNPVEILHNKDTYSCMMLGKRLETLRGQAVETRIVSSASVVLINKKVMYLNMSRIYKSPSDIDDLRSATLKTTRQFVDNNL